MVDRTIFFSISLFLLLLLSACQQKEETIKIGAILSLTGSISDQGEWVQNGLELAKDEINREGIKGNKIEIIYEDAQADPKLGVSAYQRLKAQYDIPIIITMGSGVGIALNPIINNDKVVQMGVATAAPSYSTPEDFSFRVFETAELETKNLAREIKEEFGFKDVVVLWINNDYGKGVKDSFEKFFKEFGGNIVFSDSFRQGETDFRSILIKVISANTEAIVLVPYTEEGGLILRQATELGIKKQFFSSQAILGGKELLDIAGDSANGLLIATPKINLESEEVHIKNFREQYQKTYNEAPEIYGARAYDALKILAKGMENCDDVKDSECIKNFLFTVQDYRGVSGELSFDKNGDVKRPFELKIIKAGKVVPYLT